MAGGLQGVVASTQLLGAGLSLMGVQSEGVKKLERATLQLISATQALQVIMDLREKGTIKALIIQTKEGIVTVANTVATWAATTATVAKTKADAAAAVMSGKAGLATKAAAAMQWLWNAAIMANPIGAIVLGIAAFIGGAIALTKALSSHNKESAATIAYHKKLAETLAEPLAKFDELVMKIKNTAVGTKEHTEAVDEFNKKQKETNGTLLSYNATLEETNRITHEAREE